MLLCLLTVCSPSSLRVGVFGNTKSDLCFASGEVQCFCTVSKTYVSLKSSNCVRLMCVGTHGQLAVIYIFIYMKRKSLSIYLLLVCGLNLWKVLLQFCCRFESKCNAKFATGQVCFLLSTCAFHAASIISFQSLLQKVFMCHIKGFSHFHHYHYHKLSIFYLAQEMKTL